VERGDVYHVDLNPTQGREQAGARYALVSPKAFNVLGTPLVCPTQGGSLARYARLAVSLGGAGTQTQGVVLCNQPRVIDLQARKARFVERVPEMRFWRSFPALSNRTNPLLNTRSEESESLQLLGRQNPESTCHRLERQ
jgi:mRNA interferase ChpB